MDLKNENTQAESIQFSRILFKRTLQIVIPVSLVSLLLWYFPCLSNFPRFINSCSFHTFRLSIPQKFERKYVFLLCNGILAFLAKTSVSPPQSDTAGTELSSSSNAAQTGTGSASYPDETVPVGNSLEPKEDAIPVANEEEPAAQKQTDGDCKDDAPEEDDGAVYTEQVDDVKEGSSSYEQEKVEEEEVLSEREDDSEDGFEQEMSNTANEEYRNKSTEELNRKFEEFIRKMKEEIRIEAQSQRPLIVV